MEYISLSHKETQQIGFLMGQQAQAGDIVCLCGDLGVGKTVFTKGFALGLEVTEHVTSPTFTIVNEYEGRMPLYHFDVYRIGCLEEMDETGYEDYFFGQGVTPVEWAELVKELIPQEALWITILKDYSKGEDYRKIIVNSGKGDRV